MTKDQQQYQDDIKAGVDMSSPCLEGAECKGECEWEKELANLLDISYGDSRDNSEWKKEVQKSFINIVQALRSQAYEQGRADERARVVEVIKKERDTWARESIGDKALQSLENALLITTNTK